VAVLAASVVLLLPVLGVFSVLPASAVNGCALDPIDAPGGATPGSAANPYRVSVPADLLEIDACDGANVVFFQAAHLGMAGTTYTGALIPGPFLGTYDARGFEIRGLTIDVPETAPGPIGLFGELGGGGTLDGIRLVDVSVVGRGSAIGALVGRVLDGGEIFNVEVSGGTVTAVGAQNHVGGLVGSMTGGRLMRAKSDVELEVEGAGEGAGGLVGALLDRSVVEQSFARADVTSAGTRVGGLVGFVEDSDLIDVAASGTVIGGSATGGLVGALNAPSDASITCDDDEKVTSASSRSTSVQVLRAWSAAVNATLSDVPSVGSSSSGSSSVGCGGETITGVGTVTSTDTFWESNDLPTASFFGAVRSGAALRSIATYTDTSDAELTVAWPIVAGWSAAGDPAPVWGICDEVFSGYPFLLWQFESDPCGPTGFRGASGSGSTASGPSLVCAPSPVRVGAQVTCTVDGGPADFEVLWRAAYNPTFGEGVVKLGSDGSGTFAFLVPAAALGQPVSVNLVDWTAPLALGVAQGPVPTSIPAGRGPTPHLRLVALLVALLSGAAVSAAGPGRRTEGAAPHP